MLLAISKSKEAEYQKVANEKKARADKVWLVIHNNSSEDKAIPFIDRVQKQLKKSSIKELCL